MTIFTDLKQPILKFVRIVKGVIIVKTNSLAKEEHSWQIHMPQLQNYYKATAIQIVLYWHKNKHTDQHDKIESLVNKLKHP